MFFNYKAFGRRAQTQHLCIHTCIYMYVYVYVYGHNIYIYVYINRSDSRTCVYIYIYVYPCKHGHTHLYATIQSVERSVDRSDGPSVGRARSVAAWQQPLQLQALSQKAKPCTHAKPHANIYTLIYICTST